MDIIVMDGSNLKMFVLINGEKITSMDDTMDLILPAF